MALGKNYAGIMGFFGMAYKPMLKKNEGNRINKKILGTKDTK